MIKAILVFNNQGKPRLTKFYQYYVSVLPTHGTDVDIDSVHGRRLHPLCPDF